MKKKIISFTFIGLTTLLVGCGGSSSSETNDALQELMDEIENLDVNTTDVVKKEVNDLYAIEIPSDLTMTTSLNSEASLQYNNIYSEKYIIVIDEEKQYFVDALNDADMYDESLTLAGNFAEIQLSSFSEEVTITNQSEVIDTKVNGMEARLFAFDAEVEGIDVGISYWTGYFVGKDRLYTVMAWTLKSDKDNFEEEANAILKSIEEL